MAAEGALAQGRPDVMAGVRGAVSTSHNRCHCERSEAIQIASADGAWIASLRSQ